MLWPVVQHVAPLTERRQVSVSVVGRVVVAVRGRQYDAGDLHPPGFHRLGCGQGAPLQAAPPIAPAGRLSIPPTSIAKVLHVLHVQPSAPLAPAPRPHEADDGRELQPVDRVEMAMLAADRH